MAGRGNILLVRCLGGILVEPASLPKDVRTELDSPHRT
jgi:hypothetical protein